MKIFVKVKIRTSRNKLLRGRDGTFTAYLTAAPIKGQANKALVKLLSEEFNVAKSSIQIVKGATSKNKIISMGE